MYEVVWTRLLGSVIGNTHFSITVVVSVFMGGLALGSFIGGRLADRSKNPLRLYGILILCVGAGCLLVPAAVALARPLFGMLYKSYDGVPEAPPLLIVRLLFSAIVLLIPTSFMGATLPALSRHLAGRMSDVGGTIGRLYTINTFGAVAGTVFTGFYGIPALGIWGSTALAVTIDVLIGAVVLVASRGTRLAVDGNASLNPDAVADKPTGPTPPPLHSSLVPPALVLPGLVRLSLFAFGAVGFADMLLQIAWTKAIVLSIGNSTYAFSLIVTLFILGIAIGGGVVSIFVDRVRNLPLLLGTLIVCTGALVSITIPILGDYPVLAARWFDSIAEPSYPRFLAVHVALVSAVILPSTILMGTVFPIVGKIRTQAIESVGSAVGSAYFWNTLGSILGTLAAGFVFIPLFGRVYWTLYLGTALSVAMGVTLVVASLKAAMPVRLGAAAAIAIALAAPHLLFFLPYGVLGSTSHFWHPSLLSRGAYVYYQHSYYDLNRNVIPRQTFIDGVIARNEILSYKEGIHAPVAVVRDTRGGEMAMRISGKVEASLAPGGSYNTDLPHQVMAGHLPMILHPDPKNVATLGLGGGVTLGTLTLYPIDSVDSLEIAPEVIEAARDFFGEANHHALVNPKVRNVVGDGRNHLEYTPRKFDVITSVPSNPWIAGIGNLFTVEFFRICRSRLTERGVVCNWIHKINMRADDFKTVVRTFIEVFGDHAQMWDLGYDTLLIGGTAPIPFDAARFIALLKNPTIARDLEGLGIHSPETLLRHYQLDAAGMRRYADSTSKRPLNTDAFPVLEFSCPYGLYGHSFDAYESASAIEHAELSPGWISGPVDLGLGKGLNDSFRRYELIENLYAENLKISERLQRQKKQGYAIDAIVVEDFRRRARQIVAHLKAVETTTREGDPWLRDHLSELASTALGVAKGSSLPATLGSGFLASAKASPPGSEERVANLREAASYAADDPATSVGVAYMFLELKDISSGLKLIDSALERAPKNANLLQTRGILLAAGGQIEAGVAVLRLALESTTDMTLRSEIYQNTGYAFQLSNRLDEAVSEYTKAVAENSANEKARAMLQQLLKRNKPQSPGG